MKLLQTLFIGSALALLSVAPMAAMAQQPLSCSTNVSTVRAGESVTFTAAGGWGGVYNWATPERTYLNVGSQLNTVLFMPGAHAVTVTAGAQTAACPITVTGGVGTGPINQVPSYPVTYFNSQYVPNLPNTGFAPLTAASFGFAIVLLIASALFISPYVKRTLTSTFR